MGRFGIVKSFVSSGRLTDRTWRRSLEWQLTLFSKMRTCNLLAAMPPTDVIFFCESDRSIPTLEWLADLRRSDHRAYTKCLAAVSRLRNLGHELRRPNADLLRDGIYELRIRVGHVNYRLLYFFHGRNVAILAHGLTKEREVPERELNIAVERKRLFEANPSRHSYRE
jgi:phage-related protein